MTTTGTLKRGVGLEHDIMRKYKILQEAYDSYQVTKVHLRRYADSRLKLVREGALVGDHLTKWLGTEQEMVDALIVHQKNLLSFTREIDVLPSKNLNDLKPEQRLEIKRIQIEVQQDVVGNDKEVSAELVKRKSIAKGQEHGLSDGLQNKPRNYRPSLIRAVISDAYRKEYIKQYNAGYRDGLQKFRLSKIHKDMTEPRNQNRER